MAQPIILDCDPGHDDAIALVLALASPELDVKAVTSSAGNQTPDKTLRNVLRMLTLLKRTDIPVAGGAVKPLMRELIMFTVRVGWMARRYRSRISHRKTALPSSSWRRCCVRAQSP